MKRTEQKTGRRGWIISWIIQICAMAAVCLGASLLEAAPPPVRALALWVEAPVAGGASAFWVVRRGLSNYLAWIAPPVTLYAAFLALWGDAPPLSAALLCALAAFIGAAAGEVSKYQK